MMLGRSLPPSWALVVIQDVVELGPRGYRIEPRDTDEVSFVPMAAIEEETGRLDASERKNWSSVKKGYTRFQDGDVVFAKITPCMENGKTALATGLHGGRAAGTTELHVLRPSHAIDSKFLLHFLLQPSTRVEAQRAMRGAAGQLRVPGEYLASLAIPLPPIEEQHRIVAAIEEHLTKLDAAIASLDHARANTRRYRNAVLQWGVTGRTRLSGASPGKFIADGIEVPQHWRIAPLRDVADLKGGVTKGPERARARGRREVPYLRVANVQRGFLDLSEVKTIPASNEEIETLALQPGDVLFNEGGDRDKLGRGWIWRGEIEDCIHQNHVFRARIRNGQVVPEFLSWYANSAAQEFFVSAGKQTTNLASLSLTKLGSLPVPIPPLSEQKAIVAEIGRCLSYVDRLRTQIDQSHAHALRLRQGILTHAFEGNLVAQDPNDEPAAAMFERLRSVSPNGEPRRSRKSTRKRATMTRK